MNLQPPITVAANPWWWQALTSRLSLLCLGVLVAAALVLLLAARVALVLGRRHRLAAVVAIPTDTNGTASIELALVTPIMLFLVMLLAQTTMLMGGNLYVHYAAFCAARAAIVQIPRDLSNTPPQPGDEGPDVIINGSDSVKLAAIQTAAAAAVMPACGRLSTGNTNATTLASGFQAQYQTYGQAVPQWVTTLIADQFRYAVANTVVSLRATTIYGPDGQVVAGPDPIAVGTTPVPPSPSAGTPVVFTDLSPDMPYQYTPHDPVTVRVSHQFNLGVPYVNILYADGVHTADTGQGRYATIIAQTTLTNEGIIDQIFPPSLPRQN